MKILNFGSLNMDYVYQVDHFVLPGETLNASSMTINAGGKGLNQSIALSRAGAEVYHAGCIGMTGLDLCDLLKKDGINTSNINIVNEPQGSAIIQVNSKGENCIVIYGGSNRCCTVEHINNVFSSFTQGDYLVLQNEINNLDHIIDTAHDKDMVIFLNPSPFNESIYHIDLDKIDWLLVNEIEMKQLTNLSDPIAAWNKLHCKHPNLSVLITLGSNGSMAFTHDNTMIQPSFRVHAVDTTAAGDTYTGYFVAGLSKGLSLHESMLSASKAAAISVTRAGAAKSIPYIQEVIDFQI